MRDRPNLRLKGWRHISQVNEPKIQAYVGNFMSDKYILNKIRKRWGRTLNTDRKIHQKDIRILNIYTPK